MGREDTFEGRVSALIVAGNRLAAELQEYLLDVQAPEYQLSLSHAEQNLIQASVERWNKALEDLHGFASIQGGGKS